MASFKNIVAAAVLTAAFAPVVANADIVISNDPTQNMSCASNVCAPSRKYAVLNATDLLNMLATGSVTINTSYTHHNHFRLLSVYVNVPLNWATPSILSFGWDATINAPVTIMGTGGLSFGESSNVYAPITVMGAGSIATHFPINISFAGSLTFWDLSSKFTENQQPVTLVGDVPTLAADIAATEGTGLFALANDYDAKNDVFSKAPIPEFKGDLKGLGHTITNLTIKKGQLGCEGLVSRNDGYIHNINLQSVRIVSSSQRYVGGLAGCNFGTISVASVDGSITGASNGSAGGVAGENQGTISDVYATVSVSGGQAGGVAGENDNELNFAYATGSITGTGNSGGLIGANKARIRECYSTASVNGNDGTAGGLAGFNSADITDCYSTGMVAGTGYVGGFVGYDPNETITNGYWDLDTSGISDPQQGSGFPKNDPSPVGLTTAQFQKRLPLGFNKQYWRLDPNINGGFPYLRYLPPQ